MKNYPVEPPKFNISEIIKILYGKKTKLDSEILDKLNYQVVDRRLRKKGIRPYTVRHYILQNKIYMMYTKLERDYYGRIINRKDIKFEYDITVDEIKSILSELK